MTPMLALSTRFVHVVPVGADSIDRDSRLGDGGTDVGFPDSLRSLTDDILSYCRTDDQHAPYVHILKRLCPTVFLVADFVERSYADIPVSQFAGGRGRDDRSCPLMDDQPPPPHSDERNRRFKLIPRVLGGPWMVRKAVGSTPVLLGTKIHHR